MSFATVETNRNQMDQLDNEKKKVIENVLSDEFCSLNIESQTQGETCMIQNLKFWVKRELVVDFSFLLTNEIVIYKVISVSSCLDDMQMISENTYSCQIKLIGQSLCISKHGIGYLNLAFAPKTICKAGVSSKYYVHLKVILKFK